MFIWYYFELVLMVLLPLFVLTQMLLPALRNKPSFPFFRYVFKRKRQVEEEIRILEEAKEVKTSINKVKKLKREIGGK